MTASPQRLSGKNIPVLRLSEPRREAVGDLSGTFVPVGVSTESAAAAFLARADASFTTASSSPIDGDISATDVTTLQAAGR